MISSSSKSILIWIVTPVAATVAGGIIGHALKSDYGWKAGAGVGLVAGLLGAVGLNEASSTTTATPAAGMAGAPPKVKTVVRSILPSSRLAPAPSTALTKVA